MPVTWSRYVTTLKGYTAAGARMNIKAMGFYAKVIILERFFHLEYKVMFTIII